MVFQGLVAKGGCVVLLKMIMECNVIVTYVHGADSSFSIFVTPQAQTYFVLLIVLKWKNTDIFSYSKIIYLKEVYINRELI